MKDTKLSAAKYIVVDSRRLVSKSGLGGRCLRDGASRIWQAYGQATFERGAPLVRRPQNATPATLDTTHMLNTSESDESSQPN